jgi:anti-sigma factor RsiW
VLVYKHAQHLIDVFVLPDDAPGLTDKADASGMVMRQGLNLLHRRVMGVQVWAISDLDGKELTAFADALARAL